MTFIRKLIPQVLINLVWFNYSIFKVSKCVYMIWRIFFYIFQIFFFSFFLKEKVIRKPKSRSFFWNSMLFLFTFINLIDVWRCPFANSQSSCGRTSCWRDAIMSRQSLRSSFPRCCSLSLLFSVLIRRVWRGKRNPWFSRIIKSKAEII